MTEIEKQLQPLYKKDIYYYNVKKDFVGKVNYEKFFSIPGLVTDKIGYYEDEYGQWVMFVTDSERGVEQKRKKVSSEKEAVEYLIMRFL